MRKKRILFIVIILALAAVSCSSGGGETNGNGSDQEGGNNEQLVSMGEQVFTDTGCSACHSNSAGNVAPSLDGLYQSQVTLEDGTTVTADDTYLHESIVSPQAKIVQGYQPIMPDYQDQLSDEQVNALVEYIKSLGNP